MTPVGFRSGSNKFELHQGTEVQQTVSADQREISESCLDWAYNLGPQVGSSTEVDPGFLNFH